MPGSINSHYFHVIGDKLINTIVGVYIPIVRIPIKGGMTIPNIRSLDPGTHLVVDLTQIDMGLCPIGRKSLDHPQ